MSRKISSLQVVIYVLANALSIAVMSIGIRDEHWMLAAIGLILLACVTYLTKNTNKE